MPRHKAFLANWAFISAQPAEGTLCCLSEQQRSMLLSYLEPARWPTRWVDAPSQDALDEFVDSIYKELLMSECALTIQQSGCAIQLLLNGEVISAFVLDGEQCDLLGGGDGRGGGPYPTGPDEGMSTYDEKRTALFSGAMALLKYCSEAIADLFELFEALLEVGKAATVWFETVPGLDLSPAYEVFEAADSMLEFESSVFEGSDTSIWREQESCKIMCWCVENNFIFDSSVILKWEDDLFSRYLVPPAPFYAEFVKACSYKTLIDRFTLGLNDDDEDWMLLCDECGLACGSLTFDDIETDLTYSIGMGTVADNGNPDDCINAIEHVFPPYAHGRRLEITLELPQKRTVDAILADYYIVNTGFPAGDVKRGFTLLDETEEELEYQSFPMDNPTKNTWVGDTAEFDLPVAGVKYIKLDVYYYCDCPGTREIRMDNIGVRCIGEAEEE